MIVAWQRAYGLYAAWLVALIATGGSLYFSEVRGFVPCELCWFQRILMYPIAVVLGVACYREDRSGAVYALPLALLGAPLSLYHYLQQKVPALRAPALCSAGVPCSVQYIDWFGFVTIPFLALVAFLLITVILLSVLRAETPEKSVESAGPAKAGAKGD